MAQTRKFAVRPVDPAAEANEHPIRGASPFSIGSVLKYWDSFSDDCDGSSQVGIDGWNRHVVYDPAFDYLIPVRFSSIALLSVL
jgi:hypothetical protein